jgi:hypothetical protein
MRLIAEIPPVVNDLRTWKLVAALVVVVLSFARVAPSYAISGTGLNPTSVSTGDCHDNDKSGRRPGADIFSSLSVTDPLDNVFNYASG